MDSFSDLYRNLFSWIAVAAAIAAAVLAVVLHVQRKHYAPRWRAAMPWLAAVAAVSLFSAAAYLWQSDEEGSAAELEIFLSAAEARPEVRPGGADPETYVRILRQHLDRQPRDARAWVLYGRVQTELDRFSEAALGYEKALALSPKVAKDPAVWCEYADAVAMTQGGKLAGRPRELVDRALALDLDHPKALEMAGSAEYEQGRYKEALGYWRPLLAKLEPGSRLHRELAAAVERTERLSGATPSPMEKPRTK
jgi:cytochrome c-type biogenesis protein CcmH